MDFKVKRGKFFLCELFIIVCLFFPWIVCALVKALSFLVCNIYTCFQNVWKGFVHGKYRPRTASKYVGSHCLKTQDKNNTKMAYGRKKNSSSNSESNAEVGIRIHRPLGERQTYDTTRFRRSEMVTNPTKLRARVFEDPATGLRWPLIKPGPNESWRRRVYEDNRFRVSEKTRKSPLRARLRAEDPVTPLRWPVRRPGPVQSWRCKNTPQMTNNKTVYKGRNNALLCKDRNKASAVRMQPPPVEELILRNDRNLLKSNSSWEKNKVGIEIHRLPTERRVYEDTRFRVSETTREPPFRARLRAEDPVTGLRWLVIKPEPVESWSLKNAPQMTNNKAAYKGRNNALLCKDRNKTRIRMQSPPVEERILKNDNFRSAEKVTFSSAHFPRQEVSGANFEKTSSGEQSIPSCSKKNGSRDLKRKSKPLFLHFICMVKDLVTALLLLPRKMYTYVQSGVHSYNDIYGDSKVELPYTESAFVAHLKGEDGAPYISNPHVNHDCADLTSMSTNSEIGESRNQSQGLNWKVFKLGALVRLIRELFCLVVSAAFKLRFLLPIFRWVKKHAATLLEIGRASWDVSKKQNEDPDKSVYSSHQAEGIQQTVSAHRHGAGPSVPHAVKPDVSPESGRASLNKDVNLHASSNIGMYTGPETRSPSQYSHIKNGQLNSSPPAGQQTETHVKLSTSKSKAHEEIIPERQSKTDTKTKKDVTHSVSPAHLAADKNVTPASPIKEKAEEKAPSRLTQSVPPRVKIQDQEQRLPAAAQESQMLSTSVSGDSQVRITQCNEKSSAEKHMDVDSVARAPVRKRKTDTKTKKEVTQSISQGQVSARKDVVTPAPPIKEKAEENATPPITQSVPPRVKIQDQEHRLPAAAQKSQMLSASVTGDSQVRITQCNEKSSAEKHRDVDSAARDPVRKRKTEAKTKKEVTQSISPSRVAADINVVTPTIPVHKKAEEKATPRLIQRAPARVKTKDQEHRLPGGVPESQVWPASGTGVRKTQCNGSSSAEQHIDAEPPFSRGKRAKSGDEHGQLRSWDLQASVVSTQDPIVEPRKVKRKAEGDTGTSLKTRTTEFVRKQTSQVNRRATAEQLDEMEVIESVELPCTGQEEPMELNGEGNAVIFQSGWQSEAENLFKKTEPMEADQLLCENAILLEREAMETNQECLSQEKSFGVWTDRMQPAEEMETDHVPLPATPCFAQQQTMHSSLQPFTLTMAFGQLMDVKCPKDVDMEITEGNPAAECVTKGNSFGLWADRFQSFFVQPAEEMETDHVPLPATPCFAQQQTMHSSLEPFKFTMAFGQLTDVKRPTCTDIEMPDADPTVQQQEAMDTSPVLFDACQPFKTVFGELADGKRPLASTVGVLKEESIPLTIPTAGQPVMEAAFKPVTPPPPRGAPPPLISRNVSPLAELLAESATPINSQHPQGMESALDNEHNFATIEQQLSVASEADPRSTSQLTMEQLQLVPGVSYIPDGLDSDSEDESDDAKYELNLEQQLLVAAEIDLGPTITNRLTMEELQLVPEVPCTPDGSDSDSDSDSVVDSDDEYELDLETIDRFLELDTTPEHVQLLNKLITQKELSSEQ